MKRSTLAASGLCLLVLAVGCEEEPKPQPKPETTATPTAATSVATVAEPEKPKPEKKKKTAEDCGEGPALTFDDKAVEDEIRKKLQKPDGT